MPASIYDLALLSDVQAYYLPNLGSTDQALLQTLLTGVSKWIANKCSRQLAAAQFIEARNGNGQPQLWLWNWPIISVSSVVYQAFPGSGTTTLSTQMFTWDLRQLILLGQDIFGQDILFPRGRKNIIVTYTAGYNTPGMVSLSQTVPGAQNLPEDLTLACMELTALTYKGRDRIGDTGYGMGDQHVSYFMKDMPAAVASILQLHADVVPTGME